VNCRLPTPARRRAGTVLILVLWVAFGLVALALYFAQSMTFELRAADHRLAGAEAEQATAGAARYAGYVLAHSGEAGTFPDPATYQRQAVSVGDATFWFLGRPDTDAVRREPVFGLVDEASKLNLNTATRAMLEALPRMTPELAAAIIDWRDTDNDVTEGGAENEVYLRRNPPYRCKNAPFESVEELRLVQGMELEILWGEDANRNGLLDPNENDGDLTWPPDDRDGRLSPGLVDYVTVATREPNTRSDGTPRINVTTPPGRQQLAVLLQEKYGADRANAILRQLGPAPGLRSVLEFYLRSGMTAEEFDPIAGELTVTNTPFLRGLVNVNTASATVLSCIPGLDRASAEALVSQRRSQAGTTARLAWVTEALKPEAVAAAGPFLTARSYQATADVVAVGHFGRGYRRTAFLVDVSEGTPLIRARQDLSPLGQALGRDTWAQMQRDASQAARAIAFNPAVLP
jgi:type II secretory pathway component PulK